MKGMPVWWCRSLPSSALHPLILSRPACRIQLQHRLCRHRLHLPRAHHWCRVDVAACAAFDSADLMPTVAAAALAMAVAAARTAAVCIITAPCMPLMSVSMCGESGLSVE